VVRLLYFACSRRRENLADACSASYTRYPEGLASALTKIEQDRDGKPQTVPVVTLLVSPKDAATLTMASTEGKIQLALRNTIDSKTPAPAPVLQGELFGSGAPLPAVKSAVRRATQPPVVIAPPPYTVEIIIGGKRETKNFPNN